MNKKNLVIGLELAVLGLLITAIAADLVGDQYKILFSNISPILLLIILVSLIGIILVLLSYILMDSKKHQALDFLKNNSKKIIKQQKPVVSGYMSNKFNWLQLS